MFGDGCQLRGSKEPIDSFPPTGFQYYSHPCRLPLGMTYFCPWWLVYHTASCICQASAREIDCLISNVFGTGRWCQKTLFICGLRRKLSKCSVINRGCQGEERGLEPREATTVSRIVVLSMPVIAPYDSDVNEAAPGVPADGGVIMPSWPWKSAEIPIESPFLGKPWLTF